MARGSAIGFGGADARGEDANKFVRLFQYLGEKIRFVDQWNLLHEPEPAAGFAQLLVTDSQLVHEVIPRLGRFGFAVVAVRRRGGTQELVRNMSRGSRTFHRFSHADYPYRELQETLLQVELRGLHLSVQR